MIIYNTTFHLDERLEVSLLEWLRERFIPAARSAGFCDAMAAKLIDHVEPDTVSLALHLKAENLDIVDRWNEEFADNLMTEMYQHWNDRVVAFVTPMEIIEL